MTKDELKAAMTAAFGDQPPANGATLLTAEQLLHGFANVVEQMALRKALNALDTSYHFQRQIADRIVEEFR